MIQLAIPLKSMAEGCWVGTRRYAQMDANATHVTTWPGQILELAELWFMINMDSEPIQRR